MYNGSFYAKHAAKHSSMITRSRFSARKRLLPLATLARNITRDCWDLLILYDVGSRGIKLRCAIKKMRDAWRYIGWLFVDRRVACRELRRGRKLAWRWTWLRTGWSRVYIKQTRTSIFTMPSMQPDKLLPRPSLFAFANLLAFDTNGF